MENKNNWVNTFYVFEVLMFLAGTGFLYFGYSLSHNLFNIIGAGFVLFGMIMGLMQKRRN